MVIKNDNTVENSLVTMAGAANVRMRVLIGPDDGSAKMTMRLFSILPNGHTPNHTHNFEHVVRVISGKGLVIDSEGRKNELVVGRSVFVEPGEKHQFVNPFDRPFEFTCTIPNAPVPDSPPVEIQ